MKLQVDHIKSITSKCEESHPKPSAQIYNKQVKKDRGKNLEPLLPVDCPVHIQVILWLLFFLKIHIPCQTKYVKYPNIFTTGFMKENKPNPKHQGAEKKGNNSSNNNNDITNNKKI